jgi:chemotaxis protein CheD
MNIIVGVADMKVSNDPDSVLITYSLGSCIAIAIYDPVAKVGGMLHFMLPGSDLDRDKASENPFMFADTGIPRLFKSTYLLGGNKNRMRVIMAGGSQVLDHQGYFNIGKRNHIAVRRIFERNNVMVDYADVGGNSNRTLRIALKNGQARLKISGQGETII